jgi:galactokinase
MSSSLVDVTQKFEERYHTKPLVVRSPGRINLIGEHTDYNGGFVMPAAINYDTVFAIAPSGDGKSEVYSLMYDEVWEMNIDDPVPVEKPAWANYLLGVVKQFRMRGLSINPFRCVFGGDVPLGAGLSSSASVECGFAFALNELNAHNLPRQTMVDMAQWAEHNFAGVKCGIMDQFACMMGRKGHVIVLDCRSLEFEYSPLNLQQYEIVLCDTRVKHSLVDSEYNSRRNECEGGVAILSKHYPGVTSLRDVSEDMVVKHKAEMPGKMFDRCLYVVQEIRRVREASGDLKANRLKEFGRKMYETHDGLSRMYQVSCPELDFLVDQARSFTGVIGSRMMGGGFGGCTINIVSGELVDDFIRTAGLAYREQFKHEMAAYVVRTEDGTRLEL